MASAEAFVLLCSGQESRFTAMYMQAEAKAEAARQTEYRAAAVIQGAWRGYCTRRELQTRHTAAVVLQRFFRGTLARRQFHWRVRDALRALRQAHYDSSARLIQAHWRGYYSRKHHDNYYARKAYLREVEINNARIRAELEALRLEQEEEQKAIEKAKQEERQKRELERQHVLLSTAAKKGVIKAAPAGEQMESTIRNVAKTRRRDALERSIRESMKMTRRMKEEPEMTESEMAVSMRRKPQGPFLEPLEVHRKKNKPLRPTLRCATDPDDPLRAALREKEELEARVIHEQPFLPAQTLHRKQETYVPSVNRGSGYIGDGPSDLKSTYGRQTFREDPFKARDARKAFSTPAKGPPLFDKDQPF